MSDKPKQTEQKPNPPKQGDSGAKGNNLPTFTNPPPPPPKK
jgi:hypothetical protein